MKSTFTAGLLILLLGPANLGLARASSTPPVHPPVTLPSGLDVTRATIGVDIHGQRYTCVLDTGTSAMLVSRAVAAAVGLTPEAPVDEVSPDGLHYADRHTHLESLAIAGYTMHDVPALISSKLSGSTVLCGYDFFTHVPTLIDRDRQTVTLFPATATLDRMRCVAVDLTPHVPVATLQVNGVWVDHVVLDSGMVGGGAIWNGVADRFPQPLPVAAGYRSDPQGTRNGLICGLTATIAFFDGAPGNVIPVCASPQRPDGYNGIIETNLPTVHQLAIDYPNRRVCFSTGPPSLLTTSPALDRGAWSRYNQQRPPR